MVGRTMGEKTVSGDAFDNWVEQYRPLENPDGDSGFCFDGKHMMFETYGKDLARVEKAAVEKPKTVWTMVEGDEGGLYLTNGYHVVNRFGFFITEVEHDGEEVCLRVD